MKSDLFALAAIIMWASLGALGLALAHVPPFLLTGLGLLVGSLVSIPWSGRWLSAWRVPLKTLSLGVYGLFGFHLLLFTALRTAPAVEANLINYLWPLGMIVLSPLILPGLSLSFSHIVAALLGFAGAAFAILGSHPTVSNLLLGNFHVGYVLALGSAFVWSTYSLAIQRAKPFPTAAVGGFAAISGTLALGAHIAFEPTVILSAHDLIFICALGIGPLGGAFFLWDLALKQGDPRRIGVLAFLTPLLSTVVISLSAKQPLAIHVVLAAGLITAAAILGRVGTKE